LRVPMDTPENQRVESRFAGSDANPYLAMAATLACGLLGIREQLTPTAPTEVSAKELGYDLPRSLGEALDELETCTPLATLLGPRFVRAYVSVKRKEYETFFRVISSWEREFLLLNVLPAARRRARGTTTRGIPPHGRDRPARTPAP